MKTLNKFTALALTAAAAGTFLASASGAAYMKFDGIDGEALDSEHKGWSTASSFSQGFRLHQPGGSATGATRQRGDVILDDVVVVKELDKSSPKIAEAVCNGRVFPKVDIHLTRETEGGPVTYYSYQLTNVLVTSYNVSVDLDADGNEIPVESFSLNFEEIKVTYTEVDQRGSKRGKIEYNWKVEEGEGIAAPDAPANDPTAVAANR